MAVRTPSGKTLPGNLSIIPSEQKWVFHALYQHAFPQLYSFYVISYKMPSYMIQCILIRIIFRNVQRLEMRGGICLDEEFIYPVLFKGTTSVDYQMATFVLSRENNVTMQEMMAYYNEKEDTDACLRNLELEQFDIDTSLDTQAEDFDLNDIPVSLHKVQEQLE